MTLALVLLASAASAAPAETEEVGWERLKEDVRLVVTRPFHLDRAGKRQVLLGTGATLGLYGLRHEIRREVLEGQSDSRSDFLQHARWMSRGARTTSSGAQRRRSSSSTSRRSSGTPSSSGRTTSQNP